MTYRVLSKYRAELMGTALLWIMLFHAADLGKGIPLLNLIRAPGFGGVDIFILLSAMGLVMSLSGREQEYGAFLARRSGRVLPAYYLVMLPYTLFLILTRGVTWSALVWNSSLLYYWVHSDGAFNWYIGGIMIFYAITPFCFRRLHRSRHRAILAAGAVLLGVLVCQLFQHEGYWNYMDFFYRVPIFFVGLLMGFYVREERRLGLRDLLFWLAALVAGGGYLAVSLGCDWISWPVHFPLALLFFFTTVPLCLLLCLCFERLPLGWLRRFLRLLGENSLEIYLLNASLFVLLEPLRLHLPFAPDYLPYYLVAIPANIALGCLLRRLVARLWQPKRTAVAK